MIRPSSLNFPRRTQSIEVDATISSVSLNATSRAPRICPEMFPNQFIPGIRFDSSFSKWDSFWSMHSSSSLSFCSVEMECFRTSGEWSWIRAQWISATESSPNPRTHENSQSMFFFKLPAVCTVHSEKDLRSFSPCKLVKTFVFKLQDQSTSNNFIFFVCPRNDLQSSLAVSLVSSCASVMRMDAISSFANFELSKILLIEFCASDRT